MKSFFLENKAVAPEYTGLLVLGLAIGVGAMTYFAPKIKAVFQAIGSKL